MKLKLANLATNSDVNSVSKRKLQTFDLGYFFGKTFYGNGGFQNMFVSQPTFIATDFKQENNECKISAGKSKRTNFSHYTIFHTVSRKLGLQLNSSILVVEKETITRPKL